MFVNGFNFLLETPQEHNKRIINTEAKKRFDNF